MERKKSKKAKKWYLGWGLANFAGQAISKTKKLKQSRLDRIMK